MNTNDEYWIERCLHLAKKGIGKTSPNPLVGAVIVRNNRMLASGFHQAYGGPHAEINAIRSALRRQIDIKQATLYVNLEPCFHFGNTPPCVDEIIKHRFSRVVVSSIDPNRLVAGKSIAKLKRHRIQCRVGVKQAEAHRLNEKFFKYITTGLPFISLKAAQTMDGFIAHRDGSSRWITNRLSRRHVHVLRREYDAVLVGAGTVINDNPRLTVRSVSGRNPYRIVLDGKLRSPVTSNIFDGAAPTIVYTSADSSLKKTKELERKNVVVVRLPSVKGKISVRRAVKDMARHHIMSVLVEGGQTTYGEFLNEGLVDKIYLYTANKFFREGIPTFGSAAKEFTMRSSQIAKLGTDIYEEFYLSKSH